MCPSQNIQELLDEFKANKSIALFLGTGSDMTGLYPKKDKYKSEFFQVTPDGKRPFLMSWNNLLLELSKAACINSDEEKAINEIKSSPLKAAILKNKLGGSYIPIIQNWLYTRCNRSILLDSYEWFEAYKESPSEDRLKETPFASLFTLADVILRQPSIKVVFTQNYNNFLSEAMKILLDKNKSDYPCRQNCKPIDIYDGWRDMPFDEDVFFIYHVHGFIPPPSEMIPQKENNHIVLSDEEFHQLSKDVFSWQNVAQLNYLTHYTCILLGLSLEDLTSLRLLRYANLERSSEKVYWIKAGDGEATQLRLLMEYFESQNLCVVNDAEGYTHFYHTLMETVKHKDNGK